MKYYTRKDLDFFGIDRIEPELYLMRRDEYGVWKSVGIKGETLEPDLNFDGSFEEFDNSVRKGYWVERKLEK